VSSAARRARIAMWNAEREPAADGDNGGGGGHAPGAE